MTQTKKLENGKNRLTLKPCGRRACMLATIFAITTTITMIGCAGLKGPGDEEYLRLMSAKDMIKPGISEHTIFENFDYLFITDYGKYGIVDIDTFEARGYVRKTYWIGYYVIRGQYDDGKRTVFTINTVNGVVESVQY